MDNLFSSFAELVWSYPAIYFLLGAGSLLTIYYVFPQIRFFLHALKVIIGRYVRPLDAEISNFQAFCNAIATPIGLGSVAGVAIALSIAGPGALFWMWIVGILGMATNFSSISLGMIYGIRKHDTVLSGPMYTIKNGLHRYFYPLAIIFAIIMALIALGSGNLFQSNQIAKVLNLSIGLPNYVSAIILMLIASSIILLKFKHLETIYSKIAPTIIFLYALGALIVIVENISEVPGLLKLVIQSALSPQSVNGAAIGLTFKHIISHGVRRAIFSNEAGVGSAAMTKRKSTDNPIQKGLVGSLGPFIDTIIVSTMTALVIMLSGVWSFDGNMQGVELTVNAYSSLYGLKGQILITCMVVLFAFSTIVTWANHGANSIRFLMGDTWAKAYLVLFCLLVLIGPFVKLSLILNLTDPFLALILIPNLIANILLAPKVKKALKKYRKDLRAGRI